MKVFPTSVIREIDAYTIEHEPVLSIDLMERAAEQLYKWIWDRADPDSRYMVFAGPGNNGGDALALARLLAEDERKVQVFAMKPSVDFSSDFAVNMKRLKRQNRVMVTFLENERTLPRLDSADLVIDGLFGSGLSHPLEGFASALVKYINNSGCRIISIDIPSGLFGEDNAINDPASIIRAHETLTFQFPKLAFFFPENEKYIGQWHILPIGLHPGYMNQRDTSYYYLESGDILKFIHHRSRFAHKGNFGHALLIAGCYGKMGAAVLASRACLRAGAGLLTVHIPRNGYEIIQTAVPEAMISIDSSDILFTEATNLGMYSSVGVGPGIGCRENSHRGMKDLLEKCRLPLVIDADGINILGKYPELLNLLSASTILTPHPKEFERIAGPSKNHYDRVKLQIEFAGKHNLIIVLKGGHTSIAFPDGSCWFNSTGNPGMATAGSGDALTGIILSLLAQGYSPAEAALLGVFVHGRAGDQARDAVGEEALIASDIINHLGGAFKSIRNEQGI